MKYTKLYRRLSIAVILALLVIAIIPATPAQAYTLYAAPASSDIGSTVTITGTGFNPSTDPGNPQYVIVYLSSQPYIASARINTQITIYEEVIPIVATDAYGVFTGSFQIPRTLSDGATTATVTTGIYYLYVCQYLGTSLNTYILAYATFNVTGGAGKITIDPDKGPVDTEVEITGADFAANANIKIEFHGTEVDIETGDDKTDSSGDFTSSIIVPDSYTGAKTIKVTVSGSEATADFTVTPEVFLSMTSAEAGTEVTVEGTGFGRRQEVTVWFDNAGVATTRTDGNGSFPPTTFTVPDRPAGIYHVDAEDEDNNTKTASFTIFQKTPPPAPEPTPEPPAPPPPVVSGSLSPASTGPIGMDVIFTATGFGAGKTVNVKYDNQQITTGTATADKIVVAIFKVPPSKSGAHTVTASDGTNTVELTFTVESEAPKVPTPLKPEMGVQLKPPIVFDWADITDASMPVTYTLQVATSSTFNASSIVLEKQNLDTSEYTPTENEEKDLTSLQKTLYWRVSATDAASNEGDWTGAGEFSVTPQFSIPSWALYTLIAIGGLLLFGIGYFLGRRTAFYY